MPDREKVIEGLEAMREFFGFGLPSQSPVFEAYQNILTDTIALLKEQDNCENCAIAIEDRQPIVRCKDCAYALFKEGVVEHGHISCTKPFTERWQAVKPNNWFCADGVKRE